MALLSAWSQELFASGGFARMLESVVLICGHCRGLLLHLRITFDPPQRWIVISVAKSVSRNSPRAAYVARSALL